MTTSKSISIRQLCFIIITLFSISKFYVLPALVSGVSRESGFIAVALNFLIDFILLAICLYIVKKSENSLYDTSVSLFGKTLTDITFILYAVYFFSKAFIPLVEQKNTISLTFYESQPTLLIFMPFFIVGFYIVKKGINAFSRSVEIIFWIFIFALLIIFALSVPAGRYGALLPLFSPRNKIFTGAYKTLIWFGDPLAILFLGDYLSSKKKLFKKCAVSFAVSAIITVLLVAVFYAIFDGISERQYYAPIKMSKYSITLSNIGRLDYLGSVMLSLVSVYSITLPLLISATIIKKVFNLKENDVVSPLITVGLQAVLIYFFQNEIFESISFFIKYFIPFYIVMAYALPVLFAIAFYIKEKGKRRVYV